VFNFRVNPLSGATLLGIVKALVLMRLRHFIGSDLAIDMSLYNSRQ
jgi:hypothetical protein